MKVRTDAGSGVQLSVDDLGPIPPIDPIAREAAIRTIRRLAHNDEDAALIAAALGLDGAA